MAQLFCLTDQSWHFQLDRLSFVDQLNRGMYKLSLLRLKEFLLALQQALTGIIIQRHKAIEQPCRIN